MKISLLCFILILWLHSFLNGQVAKPKQNMSLTNKNVLPKVKPVVENEIKVLPIKEEEEKPKIEPIDFFVRTADETTDLLNELFKKRDIIVNDVSDINNMKYDDKGIELKKVESYVKGLMCSKGINVILSSDEKDNLFKISFVVKAKNDSNFNYLKTIAGIEEWENIFKDYGKAVYRRNNFFATMLTIKADTSYAKDDVDKYYLTIEKGAKTNILKITNDELDFDKLIVTSNIDETNQSVVNFFHKMGINFLYQSRNMSLIDDENNGKLLGTGHQLNFEKNVSALLTVNPKGYLIGVKFTIKDAILFSKVKKSMKIAEWELVWKSDEETIETYKLNHLTSELYTKEKEINIFIAPKKDDLKNRYELSDAFSMQRFIRNYISTDTVELAKYIGASFLNQVGISWVNKTIYYDDEVSPLSFYFRSPSDSLVQVIASSSLTKTNTRLFLLRTTDINYINELKSDFTKFDVNNNYILQDKPIAMGNIGSFGVFDGELELAIKREKQENDAIAKAKAEDDERKRQEAAQRRREEYAADAADRERRRAEKAIRTSQDIQIINNTILKLAETFKKKN